jgi:hypothetical protein
MKISARIRSRCIGLALCLVILMGLWDGVRHLLRDPDTILLVPEGGAQWVRYREPSTLNAFFPERVSTVFRCLFQVDRLPEQAVLTLRAFRTAEVYLNGTPLLTSPADPKRWKEPYRIDLSPALIKGQNEFRMVAVSENAHPAILAYCDSLGIRSGDRWEASVDGLRWLPALPVDETAPFSLSRTFPRADRALLALLPLYAPLFALVFIRSFRPESGPRWMQRARISPGAFRWLLLGGWLAMAVNNFWKIPIPFGMDFPGHTQYIGYVATYWRVPLATEGWQMFQPPLFYYLEAAIFRLSLLWFDPDTVIRILKLLPLLCGAALVEISYRALRLAYPGRDALQIIGTLVGGLLPMNLYIAQSIGNEPLAGCLTALTILLAFRVLSGDGQANRETVLTMGFTLGLALLTKPTAVLIIPPLLLFLSIDLFRKSRSAGEAIRSAIRFFVPLLGVAFVVSGWYYVRNYMEMGRFFVGGWDPSREILWWMTPGYRTPKQFYVFGESLLYPVFSSLHGFWDALYSTLWLDGYLSSLVSREHLPWNDRFMTGGALLSLLPTAALCIGALTAPTRGDAALRRMLYLSITGVLLYLAALLYIYLAVPILTSVKATYAMGLTPCIALLAAAGCEALTGRRLLRALCRGILACWAVGSYASYFVV